MYSSVCARERVCVCAYVQYVSKFECSCEFLRVCVCVCVCVNVRTARVASVSTVRVSSVRTARVASVRTARVWVWGLCGLVVSVRTARTGCEWEDCEDWVWVRELRGFRVWKLCGCDCEDCVVAVQGKQGKNKIGYCNWQVREKQNSLMHVAGNWKTKLVATRGRKGESKIDWCTWQAKVKTKLFDARGR